MPYLDSTTNRRVYWRVDRSARSVVVVEVNGYKIRPKPCPLGVPRFGPCIQPTHFCPPPWEAPH